MSAINHQAFPGNDCPGLSKLEYALIHGNYEPSQEDIHYEMVIDKSKKLANPKTPLRTNHEIIRDLKKQYYTTLLF